MQSRVVKGLVLPDIQDEHGDVTGDEHLETGIPGT
jgi:hypothetical protein